MAVPLVSDLVTLQAPGTNSTTRPTRHGWLRLGLFGAIVALALLAVVLGSRRLPAPGRHPFDRHAQARIRAIKPDFVLIGNSMVNTRFNEPTLNRLLAPKRAAVLGVSGTKSAVWYLTLKNVILPVSHPQRVIIFFYSDELTLPRARATGAEHGMVERVSLDEEPVVEKRLAPPPTERIAWLGWQLGRLAPISRLHALAEEPLEEFASLTSSWVKDDVDAARRKREINGVFALGNLRSLDVAAKPTDTDERSFSEAVEYSFLPDLLELAAQAEVPLTFVQIRLRESAQGLRLPARDQRYTRDLEAYLTRHGAKFVDMQGESWEHIGLYGEGHHIARRYTKHYTQLFVEHMSQVFE